MDRSFSNCAKTIPFFDDGFFNKILDKVEAQANVLCPVVQGASVDDLDRALIVNV
ncbi:hypothetical protein AC1031_004339 [Aphanomyces cochlioides]|nr:hypothetical protein AC1031_004339 [Aphanomyces cochlioides]